MRPDERPGPARLLIAALVVAGFSVPVYIALINTFKPADEVTSNPAGLPSELTLDNLSGVLGGSDGLFWDSLLTSVMVTGLSVAVCTIVAAAAAFPLARWQSRWGRAVELYLLIGLMLPSQVILVPVVRVLQELHVQGTLVGLVLFNMAYYLPFATFVFVRFIRTIPRDLDEAAMLDGATGARIFWRIILPLLKPATSSVVIFLGVWIWNDFLNPLIILGPGGGTTVTVGIYRAIGQYSTDYGALFGFVFMSALPVVVAYLALQRQFISGLTAGATKA